MTAPSRTALARQQTADPERGEVGTLPGTALGPADDHNLEVGNARFLVSTDPAFEDTETKADEFVLVKSRRLVEPFEHRRARAAERLSIPHAESARNACNLVSVTQTPAFWAPPTPHSALSFCTNNPEARRAMLCEQKSSSLADWPSSKPRGVHMPDTVYLPDRLEVTREIPAPPAAIFDIVRSPAGQVAIDASGMLQDFTGEPAEKVGDTFVIHMDRESLNDFPMGKYDVTVHIIRFERDKEIAWNLGPDIPFPHFYGYRLNAREDGITEVTSYYDWSKIGDDIKDRFPIVPESALRATLGILERTVRKGL